MKKFGKISLVCIAFAAVLFVTGLRGASAYTIDGSDWDRRGLSIREWGTSDAQAQWHGSDGADLNAWAWDANSGCDASAMWGYDLGYESGTLSITWSYHIHAEFDVDGQGIAFCCFWFDLWSTSGRVGASSVKVYQSDINSDKTVSKTFYNLPYDFYDITVYASASADSDTDGSSAEADAYYGPLQITSNWLAIN